MSDSTPKHQGQAVPSRKEKKSGTCGIVMPIGSMGDSYSEEHWRRVRKIVIRAIERAEMQHRLVWENPEVDVIQSAILQNLYENDVVICDVSGLNPNVMLEAGLRLSTKRPTIIITDKEIKPPFDISVVGYIDYQKDLEYNAIEDFIERLSKKISSVHDSYLKGDYKSFVEQFKFEIVSPETVSTTFDSYLKDQIDRLTNSVLRIESRQRIFESNRIQLQPRDENVIQMTFEISELSARKLETEIDIHSDLGICSALRTGENSYTFTIPIGKMSLRQARSIVREMYEKIIDDEIPF